MSSLLRLLLAKAASHAQLIITLEVSCDFENSETTVFFAIVIKHHGKGKRIDDIIMQKPSEDDLYHFKEDYGPLQNFVPDHPLNTDAYK